VSESDPTQQALNAASAAKTIVDLAANQPEFKEAGTNLAKSAKTVTALIDNCLLPIAAVNFAFDKGKQYFQKQFKNDLEQATATIPTENIIEPKASIAAPILQGLTFSHEEPELKSLFLNLLKSSMDNRVSDRAHPAFVEVIRQLTAEEARLLRTVLTSNIILPIAEIRKATAGGDGYNVLKTHVLSIMNTETNQPIVLARMSAMVDNWCRLGLISVTYRAYPTGDSQFNWVESRPEYIDAVKKFGKEHVTFEKGGMIVSSFGHEFRLAAI
jgi:Abortive infection alpha